MKRFIKWIYVSFHKTEKIVQIKTQFCRLSREFVVPLVDCRQCPFGVLWGVSTGAARRVFTRLGKGRPIPDNKDL